MKENPRSKADKYNDALNTLNTGLMVSDCVIVAFEFPEEQKMHFFHFSLMQEKVFYYLFDGWENKAAVLMKDDSGIEMIRKVANEFGGKEFKLNLNGKA